MDSFYIFERKLVSGEMIEGCEALQHGCALRVHDAKTRFRLDVANACHRGVGRTAGLLHGFAHWQVAMTTNWPSRHPIQRAKPWSRPAVRPTPR